MEECKVEQSSLTYRWTFEKILSSLPTPGTSAFATLCRELRPYGISPSGVSLEAPTSLLADVIFRVFLLNDRVTLRVSYGWYELFVNYLSQDDDTTLVKIAEAIFTALAEADKDACMGQAQVTLNTHVNLLTLDPDSFLRKHLLGGKDTPDLIPFAFSYNVKLNDSTDIHESNVAVTKSIQFDNALFVSLSVVYSSPGEPAQTSERFGKDCERAFELIGLKFKDALQDGGTI